MPHVRNLAALILVVVASTSGAQQPAPQPTATPAPQPAAMEPAAHHPQDAKPTLDAELSEHFKGIALTDAQVRHVTAIKAKHHGAMATLRQHAKDPNDPALKAALQAHMDAEHAEFTALLTPEQATHLEANTRAHHSADGMNHGMQEAMKHAEKPAAKGAPTKKP